MIATGTRSGAPASVTFELLDYYDEARGMSAMMRTTGFSLALTGLMQATGEISPGVHTPDEAVPFRTYVDGLAGFGVTIRETSA